MKNEKKLKNRLDLVMDKYQKTGKKKYSNEYVEEAHKHTMKNYEEIIKSTDCTCMYCGFQFDPNKTDEELFFMEERDGKKTLLCPICGIDTVIGSSTGFPVTDIHFIARCTRNWFNGYSRLDDKGFSLEKINYKTIEVD